MDVESCDVWNRLMWIRRLNVLCGRVPLGIERRAPVGFESTMSLHSGTPTLSSRAVAWQDSSMFIDQILLLSDQDWFGCSWKLAGGRSAVQRHCTLQLYRVQVCSTSSSVCQTPLLS